MKIHRTKKGCMNTQTSEQQRFTLADKMSEDQIQDDNYSATDSHALTSDEEFLQALDAKCEKLNLPHANAKNEWERLDEQIVCKT